MLSPLDALGEAWELTEEVAQPGYYAATLSSGIRCEITVGPKSAVHRYTFPAHPDARLVVDFSQGGIGIPYGATTPLRAHLNQLTPGVAQGELIVEGTPLAVHVECDPGDWRELLWYDRRLMPGGTRLDFDRIRPTNLRPFGLMWRGRAEAGQVIELRFGFSLRGVEQARENLRADCPNTRRPRRHTPVPIDDPTLPVAGPAVFERRKYDTQQAWNDHLGAIRVETPSTERQQVFYTALYHSMIKPCFAWGESPFWPNSGPFVFDICTMWDIYRTQLPLITALFPHRAAELANALLNICEEEGNFPIGYRMAKGADRFSRQGSALAQTFLADLCELGIPGIDWDWALCHMDSDLRRAYGEDFLLRGVAHPITHTLDLAFAYHCTAKVAAAVGDADLAEQFTGLATQWRNAFDADTALLVDSEYYEGGKWNYSFRVMQDMQARIELAGGDERFVDLLDAFFGFGADPVKQVGERPSIEEMKAGYALNRFEGLNNEPDMEVPWAYHYAGRPDRTAEVVHAGIHQMFGLGRGGLPGNDDSGGLSSWFVWASLGIFPAAGQSLYFVNTPSFERAVMMLGGQKLIISTEGFTEPGPDTAAQYVQSVTFNGEPLDRSWLTARELHAGGTLHLRLGARPSSWATDTRPPSVSAPGEGYPARTVAPPPTAPMVRPDAAESGLFLDPEESETT